MKFLLLVATSLVASALAKDKQIEKVVALLTDLKAKVESDGKSEMKSYDKFACWCEDTLGEKATAISEGKTEVEDLTNTIIKTKGDLGVHRTEISQLKKDIAANIESQRESTEVREKEAKEYEEDKLEAEQCIGALEAAIKVLQGSSSSAKKGFLETLQEAQVLSVVAGIRNVLKEPFVTRFVADRDLEVVRRFVDRPEDYVGGRTGYLSAAQIANNPFGDYAPQSTQVQGVLKGMYDSFTGDLEKSNAEEAGKVKSFEELMETKKKELKTLETTLEKQTMDEATKTKLLADSKVEIDDAKDQVDADEKLFAETKDSCQKKASDWAERTRLRTEELQGITKAIEILSSEQAKETFKKSSGDSFLQLRADTRNSGVRARGSQRILDISRAYSKLRSVATDYHSLSLARIAVALHTTGPFDKVMGAIDSMIAKLREEEQEDIKHRDTCQGSQTKNKNNMVDLDYDITKLGDAIKRVEDDMVDDQKKLDKLAKEVNASKTQMDDLKSVRQQNHDKFVQSIKDDADAVKLIQEAIDALTKFYSENKFLQEGKQAQPTTNWKSGKYSGRSSESSGIIAILEMLKEDLEKEVETARKDEAEDVDIFEKDSAALQDSIDAQQTALTETKKIVAEKEIKKTRLEEKKEQKNGDLDGEKEKKSALEADCAWVEKHFADRRKKRKAEIAGLVDAKNFLAGAQADDSLDAP